MLDWVRFALTALLLVTGLFILFSGVLAQYRFHYLLNRMHGASMMDSLGLLCVLLALCVSLNDGWIILKYLLVAIFQWVTSPTAGHLIARLEITTDERLEKEMEMKRL